MLHPERRRLCFYLRALYLSASRNEMSDRRGWRRAQKWTFRRLVMQQEETSPRRAFPGWGLDVGPLHSHRQMLGLGSAIHSHHNENSWGPKPTHTQSHTHTCTHIHSCTWIDTQYLPVTYTAPAHKIRTKQWEAEAGEWARPGFMI